MARRVTSFRASVPDAFPTRTDCASTRTTISGPIDDGNHPGPQAHPADNVLLVLGRINTGAEANWLFNEPAGVAFARNGGIYVADGDGNSGVVKFDRHGNYINSWEKFGADIGEFNFASRRRQSGPRISRRSRKSAHPDLRGRRQIHTAMVPASLPLPSADHARPAHLMVDAGYDRIIELDQNGKILGAFGGPSHKPGQFDWAHCMTLGRALPGLCDPAPGRALTSYIGSLRMFWGSTPGGGWTSQQTTLAFK